MTGVQTCALPIYIVRDILPLYVDGACSEASAEMVKEHLNACADCNANYQKLLSHRSEDVLHEESESVITVSYTHLDVYKRQAQDRQGAPGKADAPRQADREKAHGSWHIHQQP